MIYSYRVLHWTIFKELTSLMTSNVAATSLTLDILLNGLPLITPKQINLLILTTSNVKQECFIIIFEKISQNVPFSNARINKTKWKAKSNHKIISTFFIFTCFSSCIYISFKLYWLFLQQNILFPTEFHLLATYVTWLISICLWHLLCGYFYLWNAFSLSPTVFIIKLN